LAICGEVWSPHRLRRESGVSTWSGPTMFPIPGCIFEWIPAQPAVQERTLGERIRAARL